MIEQLKPCPFCGGIAESLLSDGGLWGIVRCINKACGAKQISYKSVKRAVDQWNTRASQPAPVQGDVITAAERVLGWFELRGRSENECFRDDLQALREALSAQREQPMTVVQAIKESLTAQAQQPNEWRDLFWNLALELKCLPSLFIDDNEHVFKAARSAMAEQPQEK